MYCSPAETLADTGWIFFREEKRRVQITARRTRLPVTLQPSSARVPDLPSTRGGFADATIVNRKGSLSPFLDWLVGQCTPLSLLPFFPVRHKAEVPSGMTVAGSTVAGWLAAAELHLRQRAGQEIVRNLEAAEEFELALALAGSLRAFGFPIHLKAPIERYGFPDCATLFLVMAERSFKILMYVDKVPSRPLALSARASSLPQAAPFGVTP